MDSATTQDDNRLEYSTRILYLDQRLVSFIATKEKKKRLKAIAFLWLFDRYPYLPTFCLRWYLLLHEVLYVDCRSIVYLYIPVTYV